MNNNPTICTYGSKPENLKSKSLVLELCNVNLRAGFPPEAVFIKIRLIDSIHPRIFCTGSLLVEQHIYAYQSRHAGNKLYRSFEMRIVVVDLRNVGYL